MNDYVKLNSVPADTSELSCAPTVSLFPPGDLITTYCYSTKFLEDGNTIDLISIGIVCGDGREYYAVNSDADWDRIRNDDWLMDNVVRHLPTHRNGQVEKREGPCYTSWSWGGIHLHDARVKPKWVIANEVRDFIVGGMADVEVPLPDSQCPQLWAYYGAYDHVALCQLWGRMISHPRFMPMYSHNLIQEMDRLGVASDEVQQTADAHDALADARWNMAMLTYLKAAEAGYYPDQMYLDLD